MKFDFTRKNDLEYTLGYAYSLNRDAIKSNIISMYGGQSGLLRTDSEVVKFLMDRHRDGLDIASAFDVTVSPKSENAEDFTGQVSYTNSQDPGAKEFGETFVGQLLLGLFGGGNSQDPVYYPQPQPENTALNINNVIIVIGVIISLVVVGVIAVKLVK